MDNELYLPEIATIDSMELLAIFTANSKNNEEDENKKSVLITSIDIVTAVYYFRKYKDVNQFISKFLSTSKDYFLLQWVRSTWNRFSQMSEEEMSDLVINQINIVNNSYVDS